MEIKGKGLCVLAGLYFTDRLSDYGAGTLD